MYISKGYDDCKTLNMDVPNDKFFDDVSIGDTVQVTVHMRDPTMTSNRRRGRSGRRKCTQAG
jgi:hypothetical protein